MPTGYADERDAGDEARAARTPDDRADAAPDGTAQAKRLATHQRKNERASNAERSAQAVAKRAREKSHRPRPVKRAERFTKLET